MQISRRSFVTVSTAVGLTGLYGVYAHLVNPLLTPAPINADGAAGPLRVLPPRDSREVADRWLSSQPWAARAAYQLRTEEAFVYFEEWEPTDSDKAVRFRPFALVWMPDGRDSEEEPIRIICDSAYLRFASKFSITDSSPGRVVGGSLEGDVRIQGKDGLDVVGRNFVFSESAMRVWSDNQVQFAHGPHRGQALGLQMELIPDETADPRDSVAVSGIRSVRLRRNVSMDLVVDGQMPVRDERSAPSPAVTNAPTPVNIRSAGSFTFEVETNVATFEGDVRVRKPTGSGDFDTLDCDKLTLTFEPEEPSEDKAAADTGEETSATSVDTVAKAESSPPAGSEEDSSDSQGNTAANKGSSEERQHDSSEKRQHDRFQGIAGNLAFRKLLAEGKQVLLTSRANDMRARMNRLEYDAENRVAVLSDDKQVHVVQESSELDAPEITLVHDEAGEVHSAWCRGAGSLLYFDSKTGDTQLHARWVKQLRKYPDPDSKLDVIELEQQAVMRQPLEESGLAADFIKLWIDPQATTDRIPVDEAGTNGGGPRPPDSGDFRISPQSNLPLTGPGGQVRIDRLLAVKNVAMISPQMHAETARLEVWFEDADLPPPPAVEQPSNIRSPRGSGGESFTPSSRGREAATTNSRAAVPVGTEVTAGSPTSDGTVGTAGSQPYRRSQGSRSITISLPKRDSERSTQDEASHAQYSVSPFDERQQNHPSDNSRAGAPTEDRSEPAGPAVVVADLIRARILQDRRRGESRVSEIRTYGNVEVTQPRAEGERPLRITGDRLNLENRSPVDQVVHVYGEPAHIRDPQAHVEGRRIHLDRGKNLTWVEGEGVLRLPVKNSLEGEPLTRPETLHIWWREKMTFDGQTAHFFEDVQTFLQESRMRCQELQVVLTERIAFDGDADASEDSGDFRKSPESRRSAESFRESPESKIRLVVCREGVDVESREYREGEMVELRRARFWELTLNHVTGATTGTGPGWISLWRRGDGNRAGLSPVALVRANKPLGSDAAEWEYSRIDFAGRTDGNMKQNFTTFRDRVQIVHGPIKQPLETVDPDHLPENGGWMRSATMTLTRYEKTAKRPAYVKMLGDGNVELEGRMPARDDAETQGENFRARADTISFDESKGLYVLRSGGSRTATIWRQKRLGGPDSRHDAQRMEFLPAMNQLKSNRAIGTIGIE